MHGHQPGEAGTPPAPTRRNALEWLSWLLGGLATAALGVPLACFYLGSLFKRSHDEWLDIGAVDEFSVEKTRLVTFTNPDTQPWDGQTKESAAYVRKLSNGKFLIFAINCAHLGCPVSWFPQSGLFMCPCHGGVYYENGARASGPPPRGLFRYDYQVVRKKGRDRLQIWAGHLPTLYDTPENRAPQSGREQKG